ncbi:hypothetical protein SLEP1_g38508 [Rubroshorea leprosula]|nr:hypothetical protein SLEP1_g38508 [Rubroshorea leprosula]
MEIEGNVGRCYDLELDIVSEVRGYVSELSSRSSLRGLVNNCNIPHHVLIRPTGVNERACSAPRDHWMPMYVHYLAAGLRRDAEVEQLSAWKVKKTKQNNYKLNEDAVEEVGKLMREEGELVDIMYLTSTEAIKAAKLYGPSLLSEAEMGGFLNAAGGLAIPKKPRKKSKTSIAAEKGATERERLSNTSARALEMQKKRKVAEPEVKRDEAVEFVPRPSPPEVDSEVREREETEVRGPSKGKELIPPPLFQKSLFDATNITGAKQFLNATLPEVDRRQARDEAMSQLGARVVRHSLKSASWNIINLYRLSTAILAFTDCRKKVKAQYPEVNIMMVTFGEQEEGVEEDGESFSADFWPLIKLRWEHDAEGRTNFLPAFDAELVAVKEEEEEQGAAVENQADLAEVQPPVVHPVSSDEVQLAPSEAEVSSLHAGDEPPPPPFPVEEQPPPSAD